MKRFLLLAALLGTVLIGTNHLQAAEPGNSPLELSADTIEYDSPKGLMVAEGGVRITRDGAVMTGTRAEYNTKTQESWVTGGVKVVKDDATLTSTEVRSYNNNHLIATGDAVLVKADNTVTGPQIEYFSDKEYALVPGPATLTRPDGVMTANQIEAFMKEDRAVGNGNVHIVSEQQRLDAVADLATYYGSKNQEMQGKVVLSGNARAVQDGNVLTGNQLTLYLDDRSMQASGGRNTLVIKPGNP